jgi:hypothetical protein
LPVIQYLFVEMNNSGFVLLYGIHSVRFSDLRVSGEACKQQGTQR